MSFLNVAEIGSTMGREEAETLALKALGWMAREDDLMRVFLGSAGMSSGDLATQAGNPEMLAAVLDFLLLDDTWVQGFAEAAGYPPEAPMMARSVLPGGVNPDWT